MKEDRYIRQTLLGAIEESGQKLLLDSHVTIIGCGGLGSIAAPYLAGAGIGKITLIDNDSPSQSNLHRQVFFVDIPYTISKAEALKSHIEALNPDIEIQAISSLITKENIANLLSNTNLVLECTDNIQAKYLVNDFCAIHSIPMVYGAIHKYDGYVSIFPNQEEKDIHLRDIFPVPNNDIPTCSEVGVLGTLAGMIGILQANEAIKYITKNPTLIGILLTYNCLSNDQLKIKLKKSYKHDIKEVFQSSSYASPTSCNIKEITIEELQENRDKYHLISILEKHEHQAIDKEVIHLPLSCFDDKNLLDYNDKSIVFYCMSGKRSSNLIEKLSDSSKTDLISLKGGINGDL